MNLARPPSNTTTTETMTIARDEHGERLKTAPQPLPFSHQKQNSPIVPTKQQTKKTRINPTTTTKSFLAATQSTQHR